MIQEVFICIKAVKETSTCPKYEPGQLESMPFYAESHRYQDNIIFKEHWRNYIEFEREKLEELGIDKEQWPLFYGEMTLITTEGPIHAMELTKHNIAIYLNALLGEQIAMRRDVLKAACKKKDIHFIKEIPSSS